MQLVEIENGDFAVTMARQLIFSAYQFELYTALLTSADDTLSALAAKAVKEVDYHRDHATQWVLRLGDGTAESHARMQAALDADLALRRGTLRPGRCRRHHRRPARHRRRPGHPPSGLGRLCRDVLAAATLTVPTPNWRSARRPHRLAHRTPRPPAGRDAEPAPFAPRSDLVTAPRSVTARRVDRLRDSPAPSPTRRSRY